MIHYRRILELHDEGISLRGISASTGNSRLKLTAVIGLADIDYCTLIEPLMRNSEPVVTANLLLTVSAG